MKNEKLLEGLRKQGLLDVVAYIYKLIDTAYAWRYVAEKCEIKIRAYKKALIVKERSRKMWQDRYINLKNETQHRTKNNSV